jgi:hypothetical protein
MSIFILYAINKPSNNYMLYLMALIIPLRTKDLSEYIAVHPKSQIKPVNARL